MVSLGFSIWQAARPRIPAELVACIVAACSDANKNEVIAAGRIICGDFDGRFRSEKTESIAFLCW